MADLHDSTEHYLSTIFEIEEEGIEIKRARIAERLGISAPSVTEHIHRMVDQGLVDVSDNNSIALTTSGRKRATSVVRRHRLAERLLVDVIGLDWAQAHKEADRWEHVISEDVEHKLAELLGDPDTCPHGNPIPDVNGHLTATAKETLKKLTPLTSVTESEWIIQRIGERIETEEAWLEFVAHNKLVPGTKITVQENSDDVIVISLGTASIQIPHDIGQSMYVEKAS